MRRGSAVWAMLPLAVLTVVGNGAHAQNCPPLVGRTPGYVEAISAKGDDVYLGAGRVLVVVDASNPYAPEPIGAVGVPGLIRDIEAVGSYAYVASHAGGLRVIDVSDPSAPVEVGFSEGRPGATRSVEVLGEYAYVLWESMAYPPERDGLRVVDISDPSDPVEVGFVETTKADYTALLAWPFVYVSGMSVIDVSDPFAPVEVGWTHGLGASSIAVSGSFLYGSGSRLRAIDVTDPAHPSWVDGECAATPGGIRAVVISNGTAFAAEDEGGLAVFDVRPPGTCALITLKETLAQTSRKVAIAGDHAYLVEDWPHGLRVLDVREPGRPLLNGVSPLPGSARDVAVSGPTAYVLDGTWRVLRVFDVSDPSSPLEVGSLEVGGDSIHVAEPFAYVSWPQADGHSLGDMCVIDVSSPAAPVVLGCLEGGGALRGMAVSGEYAYLAMDHPDDEKVGLHVIDLSEPSAPVERGFCHLPDVGSIALSGHYAYVAAREAGLRIVDVSNPHRPVEVGFLGDREVYSIAVSGQHAFVAGKEPGPYLDKRFWVIDVADPAAPVEVGEIDRVFGSIAVSGSTVYVADSYKLWVIDVSRPEAPCVAAYNDVHATGVIANWRITIEGDLAYIAHDGGGVGIYDLSACRPRCRVEPMELAVE